MPVTTTNQPHPAEIVAPAKGEETGDLVTPSQDVFAIYWSLLASMRAERRYLDSALEVELFERAMEIAAPRPRGFKNSTI